MAVEKRVLDRLYHPQINPFSEVSLDVNVLKTMHISSMGEGGDIQYHSLKERGFPNLGLRVHRRAFGQDISNSDRESGRYYASCSRELLGTGSGNKEFSQLKTMLSTLIAGGIFVDTHIATIKTPKVYGYAFVDREIGSIDQFHPVTSSHAPEELGNKLVRLSDIITNAYVLNQAKPIYHVAFVFEELPGTDHSSRPDDLSKAAAREGGVSMAMSHWLAYKDVIREFVSQYYEAGLFCVDMGYGNLPMISASESVVNASTIDAFLLDIGSYRLRDTENNQEEFAKFVGTLQSKLQAHHILSNEFGQKLDADATSHTLSFTDYYGRNERFDDQEIQIKGMLGQIVGGRV